jgi:hypothetical protein
VTLWQDGLSIGEGPLLPYSDPVNQALLQAILVGRAPRSAFNVSEDEQVDLNIIRRTSDPYEAPPKKPLPPFSGTGYRLGRYNWAL